jgi:hypothetical protein
VVRQLGEEKEIRGQMRHNITFMCYSNCLGYVFSEVGSKSSIADTRLPKSHEMDIFTTKVNLSMKETFQRTK